MSASVNVSNMIIIVGWMKEKGRERERGGGREKGGGGGEGDNYTNSIIHLPEVYKVRFLL